MLWLWFVCCATPETHSAQPHPLHRASHAPCDLPLYLATPNTWHAIEAPHHTQPHPFLPNTCLQAAKRAAREAAGLVMREELRSRMRVLRRLSYVSAEGVLSMKV